MKTCPNCGANVEGLVYRCDCCGAALSSSSPKFVQYSHTMSATGDLASYMQDILGKLNSSQIDKFFPLKLIAFEMYAYPQDMVCSFNIRSKDYVSMRQEKAILTRVICYEEFVNLDTSQKKSFLLEVVKESLLKLCKRVNKQDVENVKAALDAIFK